MAKVFMPVIRCPHCRNLSKLHRVSGINSNGHFVIRCRVCGMQWIYKKSRREPNRVVCKIIGNTKMFPRLVIPNTGKYALASEFFKYSNRYDLFVYKRKIAFIDNETGNEKTRNIYVVAGSDIGVHGLVTINPLRFSTLVDVIDNIVGNVNIQQIYNKVSLRWFQENYALL